MAAHKRSWFWRPPVEQEVDEELAFHLEMHTRDLIASGMTPDAAREKAREDARKKLEDESAKNTTTPPKPLPEFGSNEDFQLAQALNRLKGKPVLMSKTMSERKAEVETN